MSIFNKAGRSQIRGRNNYTQCGLKEVSVEMIGQTTVSVTLNSCPTMVDRDKEPFTAKRRALYVKDRKLALKEATKEVSDFCGASMCSTCVYVDMESPVEVNNYRTAKLVSECQALEAQAALNEARRELGLPNIS